MAESKYAKYVIDKDMMPPEPPEYAIAMEKQAKAGNTIDRTMLLGLQDSILKGSFFVGCEIIWGLTGKGPVSIELPHSHDFNEVVGFAGTNRNYPRQLCGEIDFHMGGEILKLTKTCLVFIPRGTVHCPVVFKRVDTPIFMFETGQDSSYEKLFDR